MAGDKQAEAAAGAAAIRRFLDECWRAGLIDEFAHLRLLFALKGWELAGLVDPVMARPDVTTSPWASAPPVPVPPTSIPAPPPSASRPATVARRAAFPPSWWKEPQPSPEPPAGWGAWPARLRELVSSDLALHGLAYLGVLLMFVGTFGFVVFAFGELDRSLRPVAEAAIPIVCFVSAWFLHRQRAPHVAAGLELLAGLTLPLVAYASFVDDGRVPPDLTGGRLVFALGVVSLAICAGYATWSAHRPESTLRFLVGPMAWMTVWALGLSFAVQPVAGVAIRQPNPWQMTAFTLAVVGSLVLATVFPTRRLVRETRLAALPGLALGYSLVLSSGFAHGWPAWPVAVTGLATVVGIDLLASGSQTRPAAGARVAQSLVVAFTVGALVPELDLGWAGAAAVLAAIALIERWARDRAGILEVATAFAQGAAGLALATQEPWAAVVAFGAASLWAHVRRVTGLGALGLQPRSEGIGWGWNDVLAALAPAGVTYGLTEALGAETGLLVSALTLLVAAAAYRMAGTDRLTDGWLTASAIVIGYLTTYPWVIEGPSPMLFVTAVAIAGVLLSSAPAGPTRVWLGAAGLAWAAFLAMDLAELGAGTRAELFAVAGLAATGVAGLARGANGPHVAAVGQLTSLAALVSVAETPGEPRLVCLGAWTLGWMVIVIGNEMRGRPGAVLGAALDDLAPAVALVSLPLLVLDAARFGGLLQDRSELAGVLLSALALVEAAATRLIAGRRPLAPLVAWGSFGLGVAAIVVAGGDRWASIQTFAALIGVALLIPSALRAPSMLWGAWASSAALVVQLALQAGLPTDRLYAAGFGWSTVALLGGLALDERLAGPRPSGAIIRVSWLRPAVTLGALGLAISLDLTLAEPASLFGWWLLGGAVVSLVAALLLRAGWVSGISWALAGLGAAALARDRVLDDPWILVAGAVVPLGTAWILSRTSGEKPTPFRWDLPPFVVAHLLVAAGIAQAATIDQIAPSWLAAATLSFAVAVVRKRLSWGIAGCVLAAVGAWDLGPGWLAAALGAESVAAGVLASRSEGDLRRLLQIASAALTAAAWTQLVEAAAWGPDGAMMLTAIASGVVVLAAAAAARLRVLSPDWMSPAAILTVVGIVAVETSVSPGGPLAENQSIRLALAGALVMATLASAMSAGPTGVARLREAGGVLSALALGETLLGLEASANSDVGVLAAASIVSVALALALWRTGTWRPWAPAIGIFGALTALGSLLAAANTLPDRSALVAALLACGIEFAGAGLVLRRGVLLTAAPILFAGAWIAFASEAFAGDPQWFTVPIGLAALSVVEVTRWDLRRRGDAIRRPELLAMEVAGIAFLIGASPIRVVQGALWAGAIGAFLGGLVAVWGGLTRVRRRLWIGGGAATGCLLLMVFVPLAQQIPNVAGATLWVMVGAVGAAVVVIATAVERGRARIGMALQRLSDLMDDWE